MQRSFEEMLLQDHDYPIIVFLEPHHKGRITCLINEISSQPIYLVDTIPGSSTPFINFGNKISPWSIFRDVLYNMDVKNIFMLGAELYLRDNSGEIQLGGCLGLAISEMKSGFNVLVSDMTYPDKFNDSQYI